MQISTMQLLFIESKLFYFQQINQTLQMQILQFKTIYLLLWFYICKVMIRTEFRPRHISQFDQFYKTFKKHLSPTFEKYFWAKDFSEAWCCEILKILRNCRDYGFEAILNAFKAVKNNSKSTYFSSLPILKLLIIYYRNSQF